MIQLQNVWKIYAKRIGEKPHTALADVSFKLKEGETLGLIGANGAGKSTTLRLLMGFLRPDKGGITIMGRPPEDHTIRNHIGYLPETANFPPNLSILDMLRYAGSIFQMKPDKMASAAEHWLKALGVWEARKRPLRNFSKGMQQRANFALALMNDPHLLILDEPMSGLDPFGRADILNLILDLKKQGKTILFCSHILEDVDRIVDKAVVLHLGKVLFHGHVADLLAQLGAASLVKAFIEIVEKENVNRRVN